MKTVAIVQARLGSTRLPDKVLKPVGGRPMIALLLARLARCRELDQIVVATADDARNQPLADQVAALGYACFRGSEHDVLERFVGAARMAQADAVVRITGDCPLMDPALVDEAVRRFRSSAVDYLSYVAPATFPDGLDIEVFSSAALLRASQETDRAFDREHVTPYLRESGRFTQAVFTHDEDLSGLRWTVDEA